MVNKSKLSKDVEEQIQSLASDVYIQVEEQLTNLIAAAVKAEMSQTTDKQSKDLLVKEQTLQKGFSEKEQLQAKEVAQLKQTLAEKQADEDTAKQNFQVELTQNTINYTETIERLEKELFNAKQQSTQQKDDKQSSNHKLEEKLLETEQKLNDKTQEVDGLNGRVMVLTEQEQSLTKQLSQAKEQAEAVSTQQADSLDEAKKQATASAQQQIDVFAEKLQHAQNEVAHVKADALQNSDKATQVLHQKITQVTEQVKQEQDSKSELQQQLSTLQKTLDTEQDKNNHHEQQHKVHQDELTKLTEQHLQKEQHQNQDSQNEAAKLNEQHQTQMANLNEQHQKKGQDYQDQITQLNEQHQQKDQDFQTQISQLNEVLATNKQLQLDEIAAINVENEQRKQLQETAQQKIIELDKSNEKLSKQVELEQNDIKLYQQEVTVLNEQVKVAQDGQENILQRFNSNREKQEQENSKVRETIKFLRDENHQLISDNSEQKASFTDQTHELEHKLTEYRLKFEYAQKQLAN